MCPSTSWPSARPVTLLGILLWLACGAAPLRAAGRNTAIGATIGGSTRPAGESDRPYLGPGFGGTSLGLTVSVETAVRSSFGVSVEASFATAITGMQFQRQSGGTNALVSEHHDSILSLLAKGRIPLAPRFQIAVGGGVGLAYRQTLRSGSFTPVSPPHTQTPVTEELTDRVFAVTAGVDGTVSIHERWALVANLRVHKLLDDDRDPDGVVERGVSSLIFRYGLGARFAF
jgi:hypothetical protein